MTLMMNDHERAMTLTFHQLYNELAGDLAVNDATSSCRRAALRAPRSGLRG
jgi:hypothetical protein